MGNVRQWFHRGWRKICPSNYRKSPCRSWLGPVSYRRTRDHTSQENKQPFGRSVYVGPETNLVPEEAKDSLPRAALQNSGKPAPKDRLREALEAAVVAHSSTSGIDIQSDRMRARGNNSTRSLMLSSSQQCHPTAKLAMVDAGTQTTHIEVCEEHSRGSLHMASVVENEDESTQIRLRSLTADDGSNEKHSVISLDANFQAAIIRSINAGRAILEPKLNVESQQQAARDFSVELEQNINAYTRLPATGAETDGTSMNPELQRTTWVLELRKLKLLLEEVILERESLERTLMNHINMYLTTQAGALAFVEDAFLDAQLVPRWISPNHIRNPARDINSTLR